MTEERIYDIAYAIHQKYASQDLAHDGHSIWLMTGDFVKQLIIPFGSHQLAVQLMESTVGFYCDQHKKAHAA